MIGLILLALTSGTGVEPEVHRSLRTCYGSSYYCNLIMDLIPDRDPQEWSVSRARAVAFEWTAPDGRVVPMIRFPKLFIWASGIGQCDMQLFRNGIAQVRFAALLEGRLAACHESYLAQAEGLPQATAITRCDGHNVFCDMLIHAIPEGDRRDWTFINANPNRVNYYGPRTLPGLRIKADDQECETGLEGPLLEHEIRKRLRKAVRHCLDPPERTSSRAGFSLQYPA